MALELINSLGDIKFASNLISILSVSVAVKYLNANEGIDDHLAEPDQRSGEDNIIRSDVIILQEALAALRVLILQDLIRQSRNTDENPQRLRALLVL